MKTRSRFLSQSLGFVLSLAAVAAPVCGAGVQERADPSLLNLIPKIEFWTLSEEVQSYFPESLFEYINGAAESYLSYDFRELLVAQFDRKEGETTMTLEIYDMGTPLNAFGIFSAERYPENRAVSVGDAAYIESEALNLLAGKYYIKLLGFGAGEETAAVLEAFAKGVSASIERAGGIPGLFRAMPPQDLIPQSEKFIKKNFLGYEFLHNGYVASYRVESHEIECFIIEAASDGEAEAAERRLLDSLAGDKQVPEKIGLGYRLRNRYGQHLFLGRSGRYLCGVVRVPDGLEEAGVRYLRNLKDSLSRRGDGS